MAFRVAEPTLGPEVANLLERLLGCKIAREGVLPGGNKFDFFLILDHYRIIIELEIGGLWKLPVAMIQADEYRQQMNADGIIAIVYAEEARKEVTKPEDVADIAITLHPTVMVLCPFLKQYYPQISLPELAKSLKDSLSKPSLAPSVDLRVVWHEVTKKLKQEATITEGKCVICGREGKLYSETCEECFDSWMKEVVSQRRKAIQRNKKFLKFLK